MRPYILCGAALAGVLVLAFGSAAQTPAPEAPNKGALETITLSAEASRDLLLLAQCISLGSVRLRLSYAGPGGVRNFKQELTGVVGALGYLVRQLGLDYEDIAVVLFDGKWRYKTETPPEVWKYRMEKKSFSVDPKHFAIVYESICAAGYDPAADTYDVNILKDRLAKARAALTKPAVER